MDRFRKTFGVRKKMESESSETSKPQFWIEDEKKIKGSYCSFQVKYLGCIEVFESRGMQVCEEAIKALRKSKKAQRAILYVSGDALRVSDEISKHLIVDQTIEKVSFCAPDRGHDKGFAYICRDGATRRWMCHAFLAFKESGERLSHAVGCAFAICLERKQKRERDALQVTYSNEDGTFVRMSSFRQVSLSERLLDPQSAIVVDADVEAPSKPHDSEGKSDNGDIVPFGIRSDRAATLPKLGSGAIPRRRANPSLIERQTSLRLFPKLQGTTSPFKHNLSMRSTDLSGSAMPRTDQVMNGATIPEETVAELEETPSLRHSTNTTPPLTRSSQTPQPENFAFHNPLVTEIMGDASLAFPSLFHANSTNPVESDNLPTMDPFSAAPFNPATIQQHQATQQQLMGWNNFYSTATSPIPPCRVSPVFTNAVSAVTPALFPLSGWPDFSSDSGSGSRLLLPPAFTSMEIASTVSFPASSELSFPNPVDSHPQMSSATDFRSTIPPSTAMVLFGAQIKHPTQSADPSAGVTGASGMHWPSVPKPTNVAVDPFDLNWAEQATALAKGQLEAFVIPSSLIPFRDSTPVAPYPSDAAIYTNPFLASDKR